MSVPGAWALFDRSIASGFVPSDTPVRIALDHPSQVSGIKVHGAAPFRLRVRGGEGSSLGFGAIDLSKASAGWHIYPSTALVSTASVELSFERIGAAASGPVPELELWAIDEQPDATESPAASPEELAPHLVALLPDSRSADLLPGEGADSPTGRCATFSLTLARSPTTFRRVHLVYSAEGIAGAFALDRTVNGVGQHGGSWLAGDTATRTHTDQIDPSLLHLGKNDVQLCVPRDATRGVALTDVRLVTELDSGTRIAERIEVRHALRALRRQRS